MRKIGIRKAKASGQSSWRWKLCALVACLVMLVGTSGICAFYYYARQTLFDEICKRPAFFANSVAQQINAEELELLHERGDEDTEAYRQTKKLLVRYRAANPEVRRIYILRPSKNLKTWKFLVGTEQGSKLVPHIGDKFDASQLPELRDALLRPSSVAKVKHAPWGNWISGYAPIRNSSGRLVGVAVVEMSASQLESELAQMRRVGAFFLLTSVIFSIVLTSIFSAIIFRPITQFVSRLHAVVKGELARLTDDHRSDEIGQVASAFNEILQLLEHKEEMLSRINLDYLTGLYNHGYFQARLQEEIDRAKQQSGELALLMLDIDRFKLINDSLGHMAGDDILRQIAGLLKRNLHEKDIAARYGGEEFAIILPGEGLLGALKTAEKIRKAVSAHAFKLTKELIGDAENQAISLTVSIGIAVYPQHSKEKMGLIMAADSALYQAKRLGRDRVCAYKAGIGVRASDPSHVSMFLQDPTGSAIKVLAAAIDARDPYTRNHSENVSRYALLIGKHFGLDNEQLELLHMAARLHDIGKIGVPDCVLEKPASLTEDELKLVKTHPQVGVSIIRGSQNLDLILPGILYHHERYDGTGYPSGLAQEEIPLFARIIAVADAFDALTSNRPYRKGFSISKAIEVLKNNSGTQFDPKVVEAFLSELSAEGFEEESQDKAA